MFCPECKYEYCDGIMVCPDCGAELVDEIPEESGFNPDEEICCLCTAADEFEAEIIIAKLRAEGIFAAKKFKGNDSYGRIIFGLTTLGVDILVSASCLETAEEIIKS